MSRVVLGERPIHDNNDNVSSIGTVRVPKNYDAFSAKQNNTQNSSRKPPSASGPAQLHYLRRIPSDQQSLLIVEDDASNFPNTGPLNDSIRNWRSSTPIKNMRPVSPEFASIARKTTSNESLPSYDDASHRAIHPSEGIRPMASDFSSQPQSPASDRQSRVADLGVRVRVPDGYKPLQEALESQGFQQTRIITPMDAQGLPSSSAGSGLGTARKSVSSFFNILFGNHDIRPTQDSINAIPNTHTQPYAYRQKRLLEDERIRAGLLNVHELIHANNGGNRALVLAADLPNGSKEVLAMEDETSPHPQESDPDVYTKPLDHRASHAHLRPSASAISLGLQRNTPAPATVAVSATNVYKSKDHESPARTVRKTKSIDLLRAQKSSKRPPHSSKASRSRREPSPPSWISSFNSPVQTLFPDPAPSTNDHEPLLPPSHDPARAEKAVSTSNGHSALDPNPGPKPLRKMATIQNLRPSSAHRKTSTPLLMRRVSSYAKLRPVLSENV